MAVVLRIGSVDDKNSLNDQAGTRPSPKPATPGTTILVVEDDADMREVMEFMLEQLGFAILLAGSVEEAATAARTANLGLIISDLGLPGESGLSLLQALNCKGKIPAIALSGYGAEEDVRASRAAGFTEHLVKPVTPDKLLAAVRRVMGLKSASL